ncbi:MAG TPA: quinone-dependent dihydroorotate dehydrogenase [Ferruginibacter sp.]|nr:quinone-dependent dihydroorotate dehydrogenase [Ferruginibacter sp.]
MYNVVREFLFLFDPERVHYFSMGFLKLLCRVPFIRKFISNTYGVETSLKKNILGLTFKNPVGLGAGFDKNARYLLEIQTLGFGFVEIGTVTPLAQRGNEKPRLFRLKKDKALVNRMGFNNDGVEKIKQRLKKWQETNSIESTNQIIIGGNIGKNKHTSNENAWKDYEICFIELHPYVDYFVVNVSSPNTPGLRELQQKDLLKKILTTLQFHNNLYSKQRPILLKISPDLELSALDDIIALVSEINLDGLIVSNTTISRKNLLTPVKETEATGAGGLSGIPLAGVSTEMIKYISQATGRKLPIIASGGIFNDNDARQKINAGASLLQVWTGFIYEGPAIVKNICNNI